MFFVSSRRGWVLVPKKAAVPLWKVRSDLKILCEAEKRY